MPSFRNTLGAVSTLTLSVALALAGAHSIAIAAHVEPDVPASPVAVASAQKSHHAKTSTRATATVTLAQLMTGNERFMKGQVTHPHQSAAIRRELAAGQHPKTIVLACADSRVPPEIVFDQGLGDLFVVRVAGNTLDAASVASIEYAVEHLGSPLIVVMGHHSCGAVKAALTVEPKDAGSQDLQILLETIGPAVKPYAAEATKTPTLDRAVRANVEASLFGLKRRSAIVRERAESGALTLVPAVYVLNSGRVEFWDAMEPRASDEAGH